MTAVIFSFPQHPLRVLPARDGGWLVVWRSCGWLHTSLDLECQLAAERRVSDA